MAFDKSALGTKIQACIDAVASSSSVENFTSLAVARNQFCSNFKVSVATANDLPDIYSDKIPNGQVIFVEDIESLVMASNNCWIGIDRRLLRNDSPEVTAWGWGDNSNGVAGDGTLTLRSSPVTTVGAINSWCQIAGNAQNFTIAAVRRDGTLWTWGYNGSPGLLGQGFLTGRASSPATVSGGGTTWTQASAALAHLHALKSDGTLWSWGCNCSGRLGLGLSVLSCRCVPTQVTGSGWCQVSTGKEFSLAIKTDGTMCSWGINGNGQLGTGNFTAQCSPVAVTGSITDWSTSGAGGYHSLAIRSNGTLWTWGANGTGQLGNGNVTDTCSPATVIGGGTNWCTVSGGWSHSAAIKTDGTLWTWGQGCSLIGGGGRLGDNTILNRSSPGTTTGGGTNWCNVTAGAYHTTAIKTDGTLWTWGNNCCGTLGANNTVNRSSPGTVAGGGTTWWKVAAGTRHTVALTAV